MCRALLHDRLVQLLLLVFALANVLPARGEWLEAARTLSNATIFLLFLLNGMRLPRAEVIEGVRHWRLQGAIFLWVFGAMSLFGLGLAHLFEPALPHLLVLGIIFLGTLPSTVQSATAYCSLANGNVAASVVASAILNIAGVVVTPLLFAAMASAAGIGFSGETLLRILTILLLPFLIGQMVQKWALPIVRERRALVAIADRTVILLAVYVALSGAVTNGLWSALEGADLAIMAGAIALFLVAGFAGPWLLGARMHLAPADRKTLLFSGAQKSIAIGAPLAAILFSPAEAGFILLPVLLYHLLQLIVSAPVASALAERQG